jgi:hypothetical protein
MYKQSIMKRAMVFTLALTVIFFTTRTQAQVYKNAIGLRISGTSSVGGAGATYKHFLTEKTAIEGIFSFKDPVGLGALYQVHNDWAVMNNLKWYYGAGAFVSFSRPDAGFGALGVIGLDYKFDNLPLNLSLDWKPEIAFAPKAALNFNTFGVSLRVVLDKKQ